MVYLPGSNEKPPTPYTIESGDTLSQIARDELGDGTLWTTIEREDGTTYSEAEAQQIQPGQVVYLPGSNEKPPTPYTIESGDTLSQIARDELGDGTLWTTIEREDGTTYSEAEAQQIQPGQVVYLPSEISGGEQPEPSLPDELAGNFKEEIVTIASQQWEFFDRGALEETQEGAWQRIANEYWQTQGINRTDIDTPEEVGDDVSNPWSAAFVSWVMQEAGAGEEFNYSQLHANYINKTIEDRESDAAFIGHPIDAYSLQPGDLIGANRPDENGPNGSDVIVTYDDAVNTGGYSSHVDIVVATRPDEGEVDVIGGNVSDSVTLVTYTIDPEGKLVNPDDGDASDNFFVVIENRFGEDTPPPAPEPPASGTPDPLYPDYSGEMTETSNLSPNMRAFLDTIAYAEGTYIPKGYRTIFGGETFESFEDHPNIKVPFGDTYSTAAGRYQFLEGTWDETQDDLDLPDFSPESQDLGAVQRIKIRGAFEDVEAGNFEKAITGTKVKKEWASLPGSPYGQPTKPLGELQEFYEERLAAYGVA